MMTAAWEIQRTDFVKGIGIKTALKIVSSDPFVVCEHTNNNLSI